MAIRYNNNIASKIMQNVIKLYDRLKNKIERLVIFGLRGMTLVAKFALALFITKFLGLETMGLYGLILGATALSPFIMGFGLYSIINRYIVDIPLSQAMPVIVTRLFMTTVLYLILIPVMLMLNSFMGSPVPFDVALLSCLILFFEHIGMDTHGILTSRHKATLATILFFIRSGLWMLIYMVLAWFIEPLRTFEVLLYFWLGSLVTTMVILAGYLMAQKRYKLIAFDFKWILTSIPKGRYMYLFEAGHIGGQFIDRFFITFLLGLETAGIYVFFWSLCNAAYNLTYFSVVQPNNPHVIGAAKRDDQPAFRAAVFYQQKQAAIWGGVCCLAVLIATPILIDLLDKPELSNYFWIIWVLLPTALLRLGADTLQNAIYAKSKDKIMGLICLASLSFSVVFLFILIPLFGLLGATLAAFATNLSLIAMRIWNASPLLRLHVTQEPK